MNRRQSCLGHPDVRSALRAPGSAHHIARRLPLASAIAAVLAGGVSTAYAAPASDADSATLEEVVVTAQKRTENLQSVPVSIEVLSGAKLEELDVTGLDGYVKYSPSIAYSRGQGQGGNGQPGSSHIYMRGVVSGANENHSGSQPSVGTYIDEQPVTTIDGTPDIHLYDIQRIEVLEGPQGTLYGASSQAGTVRIITNKPDPTQFSASYDVQANKVSHGGTGYEVEAYANIPLSPVAAIRLVGFYEKDAGFIDNVAGTNKSACIENGVRTFPTWAGIPSSFPAVTPCPAPGVIGAGAISNAAYRKNDYNTVETKGGRLALKWDINDNWSVTPTVLVQSLKADGFFGYDPAVGDLQITHFGPETSDDTFTQAALTVAGKISNFDLTYAGAFMKRDTHSIADYSDYSEFYDRIFGSGAYWTDHAGKPIMPQELVVSKGYFEKWSHELRLSTPQEYAVRATVGLFALMSALMDADKAILGAKQEAVRSAAQLLSPRDQAKLYLMVSDMDAVKKQIQAGLAGTAPAAAAPAAAPAPAAPAPVTPAAAPAPPPPAPKDLVMKQTEAFVKDLLAGNADKILDYVSEKFSNERVADKAELASHLQRAKDSGRTAEFPQLIKDHNGQIILKDAKVTVTGDKATVYPITASADEGSVTVGLTFKCDPDNIWRISGIDIEGI